MQVRYNKYNKKQCFKKITLCRKNFNSLTRHYLLYRWILMTILTFYLLPHVTKFNQFVWTDEIKIHSRPILNYKFKNYSEALLSV